MNTDINISINIKEYNTSIGNLIILSDIPESHKESFREFMIGCGRPMTYIPTVFAYDWHNYLAIIADKKQNKK